MFHAKSFLFIFFFVSSAKFLLQLTGHLPQVSPRCTENRHESTLLITWFKSSIAEGFFAAGRSNSRTLSPRPSMVTRLVQQSMPYNSGEYTIFVRVRGAKMVHAPIAKEGSNRSAGVMFFVAYLLANFIFHHIKPPLGHRSAGHVPCRSEILSQTQKSSWPSTPSRRGSGRTRCHSLTHRLSHRVYAYLDTTHHFLAIAR